MTHLRDEGRAPRLLVLASTYPRWAGDPEPGFVHELARRLAGDFEVTVLCPHARGAKCREVMDGVQIHRYRYAPVCLEGLVNDGGIVTNLRRQPWKWLLVPGFLIGMLWALWRVSRDMEPDVIHAHWIIPQGLGVGVLAKLLGMPPHVVTVHGADLFALNDAPLMALKRFVLKNASAVTVVSSTMRDEIDRMGAAVQSIEVRPMGVDLTGRFVPDPTVERSSGEILFVGRMVEKKGLRYLIEAMPRILAECPDAHLTIAGFGPEEMERRQQVARLGLEHKVKFLGAVAQADLPALYRRAAVFAAPFVAAGSGDQEGLGLVLVEAIGCGCPVVTTRLPGVQEVFGQWQPFTVDPANSAKLAEQLCRALANAPAAAAETAALREVLHRRLDWSTVAQGYARLLHRISSPHQ